MRVITDFLKSEPAAKRLKVRIVGVGQSVGKIHTAATSQLNFGVLGDQSFVQRGEGDRKLNGRARLRAAGQSHFLVHHRQYASTGGLNCQHGTVHVAQGIQSSLANYWIFTGCLVTFDSILAERTRGEVLVIAPATMT